MALQRQFPASASSRLLLVFGLPSLGQISCWRRATQEIPLRKIAAQVMKTLKLLGSFNSFRDAGHSELVRETDNGRDESCVVGVRRETSHEGPVYLELFGRKITKVREGRVASTKIIN